jgi:Family of unknown function (DUF6200)
MMASTGQSAAGSAAAHEKTHEKTSGSQIVVVDLEDAQPNQLVKRLRKGSGKLMTKVERIVGDLVQAGTIKSTAQTVVVVVREMPPSPFSFLQQNDDDDD